MLISEENRAVIALTVLQSCLHTLNFVRPLRCAAVCRLLAAPLLVDYTPPIVGQVVQGLRVRAKRNQVEVRA
ncbi:hypothetical protein Dimus_034490 [Dionaea muscipula]